MKLIAREKPDGSNAINLKEIVKKYSPFEGKSTAALINAANNILYNWGDIGCPNYTKAILDADYGNREFNTYSQEYVDKWTAFLGFYPEMDIHIYQENDGIYEYTEDNPQRVAEEVFHELERRGITPQRVSYTHCGKKFRLAGSEYCFSSRRKDGYADGMRAYTINADGTRSYRNIYVDTLIVYSN